MIARGFKSVIWVATVGSAALGCYMVSLRVATERNELAKVERQIIAAKRDIRSLQTELGTRGRMTQLEQWNAEVLALSAPSSAQFLKDEFTLARLYRSDPTVEERSAEVRLASADTSPSKPAEAAKPATPPVVQAIAERPAPQPPMIHRASFTTAEAPVKAKPAPAPSERARSAVAKADKPAGAKAAPAVQPKPDRTAKAAEKPAKPAAQRTAAAGSAKPEPASSRTAAKPAPKGEALRTAAARPAREAAAAPRSARVKGGGGN